MTTFHAITCYRCKVVFGMAHAYYEIAQQRGEAMSWFCPNGHSQVFTARESEAEQLRRERDRLKQNAAYLEDRLRAETEHREAAQRQARALKGVATRMKNRAAAGVCPCCNRTFAQLQRHMASKHPSFAAEALPDWASIQ